MKEVTIAVSQRESFGKGPARQSRMAGKIPAVVYGPEMDPISIEVDLKAFRAAIKEAGGTSAIITLQVNGKSNKVIIRDLQRDPVTSDVIHIDFHAISMTKAMHLKVPIRFIGEAEGVKTEGGILQTVLRELEVLCLPTQIPDQVEVDVSELNIGESVHVSDLDLPDIKILTEEERTIVVVSAPTVVKADATAEEEAEAEAAAEGEEGALAEGEGEKAEGGEAGEAGEAGKAGKAGKAGDAGKAGKAGDTGKAGKAGKAGDAGKAK